MTVCHLHEPPAFPWEIVERGGEGNDRTVQIGPVAFMRWETRQPGQSVSFMEMEDANIRTKREREHCVVNTLEEKQRPRTEEAQNSLGIYLSSLSLIISHYELGNITQ